MPLPKLLITLGDVAGIGPEIVAKAWGELVKYCRPIVVGDIDHMMIAMDKDHCGIDGFIKLWDLALHPYAEENIWASGEMACINPSKADLSGVQPGKVSAEAGRAAYDWLTYAIDECLAKRADGIVTCPLHKEGLHGAGVPFPGHTEILAERTGAKFHAMLLYDDGLPLHPLPAGERVVSTEGRNGERGLIQNEIPSPGFAAARLNHPLPSGERVEEGQTQSLAVAHVTLHRSLRSVFDHITPETVLDKIRLLHGILPRLIGRPPRIGVAALNPHAGDGGLFGNEEEEILRPAIERARAEGITVKGPFPADAIFQPQHRSQLDGIVAMYHDQGHIAMKLLGGRRAVNITAGLPIVRTSVAHGTAYDIVGKGIADESSLISAVKVAARLAMS